MKGFFGFQPENLLLLKKGAQVLVLLFINLKAKLKYLEVGRCSSSSLLCQLQKSEGVERTKPAGTKPKTYILNIHRYTAVKVAKKGLN